MKSLNSLSLTQITMQLASLQTQKTHDDCHSMTLFFGLEEHNNFSLIKMSQGSYKDSLSILISIFFEFDDLLMQFLSSFLNQEILTLSGSALNLMGFFVVM